jgi:hypothetical protein
VVELFKSDYATFVGLWLNRSRISNRQSLAISTGVGVALKPMLNSKITDQYFADVTETHDQSVLVRDLLQPEG